MRGGGGIKTTKGWIGEWPSNGLVGFVISFWKMEFRVSKTLVEGVVSVANRWIRNNVRGNLLAYGAAEQGSSFGYAKFCDILEKKNFSYSM